MRHIRIVVKTQFGEFTSKIYDLFNMHDFQHVNNIRTQTYISKSMEMILDDGSISVFSEELLRNSMIVIKEQKMVAQQNPQ
jgi:hypothetical protein